jgi:cold shock protein
MTDTQRQTARVKWFNPKAGYGFLTNCSDSADVFVHHSQIVTTGNVYKTLTQGEYIDYDTTTDDNGKVLASNVTGVQGGPLLCERPRRPSRRDGGNDQSEQDQGAQVQQSA